MKYFEYFCNLNSLFKKSDEKKDKYFIWNFKEFKEFKGVKDNRLFISFCYSFLDAVFFVGTDEMELRLSGIHRPI